MVEEDDTAAKTAVFPVILFDGERETDVGNVEIHQDLLFKEFQMKLSQMIGISYNNLTTYLVDSRKSKISPERRKILITGKVNFAVIVRERNCYFLVVLKRSRRDRRRKPVNHTNLDFPLAPDDLSRIHWNQLEMNDAQMSGYSPYYYDERFHDLLIQRENYVNMILNSRHGFDSFESFDSPLNMNFPKIEEVYPKVQPNRALCEVCTAAQKQGNTAEFHLCVYDEVIPDGFRSPAGPISRRR